MNPAYLEDASGYRGHADAVCLPATEGELASILRDASAGGIPVTIAGAGTGLAGGRVAQGGWVISLERFNHIEIKAGEAIAGAGVLLRELQSAAARSGQFYAPDPTENSASIGGTIATNASGSRSFLYGDTRSHVLGIRVVFMDGTAVSLSRGDKVDFPVTAISIPKTTKHSAGFLLHPEMDMLDLFVGSEGTLGVITEARLKLLPAPGDLLTGVIFFNSDENALAAVRIWREWRDRGVRMLEYFDAGSLDLLRRRYTEIPANARAALLIEQISENGAEVDAWLACLDSVHALTEDSWFATTDADRERFRIFRHAVPEAVNDIVRRRGLLKMGTDFAVPIDRNDEMMRYYRDQLDRAFPGQYVIFGHIGDAHVHVNILPHSGAESDRAKALINQMAGQAVSLGGTVAAEHGLGKRKAHLLAIQYAPKHVDAMLAVKRRFDPKELLGQGNLFPASII